MVKIRFARFMVLVLLCCWMAACARLREDATLTLELSAGAFGRQDTPVYFELPEELDEAKSFTLSVPETKQEVDVQRIPRSRWLVWILEETLAAGKTRRYELTAHYSDRRQAPDVNVKDDSKTLQVDVSGQPVLVYNQALLEPPEGASSSYRHSGNIHPIYNPAGQAVTDDFPPDHLHQRGLFFAWVNTTFEGRHVDFWNLDKEEGEVKHSALGPVISGTVFGQFSVQRLHMDKTAPEIPKAAIGETWMVRVYDLRDYYLIDLESRQRTPSASPLIINQYHYGGLALRGARQWFHQKESDFLTDEGKTRKDGNHSRPRWVEMHGLIDGRPSGIAVMDHPKNFRFPQPVRLHPDKPYFCFSPMVLGEFQIDQGAVYRSRYRIYVHNGEPDASASNRIWNDYAEPPRVTVASPTE